MKVLPKTSSSGFFNSEGFSVFWIVSFETSTGRGGEAAAALYNLEACHASAGDRLANNAEQGGMAERHRVAR